MPDEILDASVASRWFDEYVEAFYGSVQATSDDLRVLLDFYHVPLISRPISD